MGWQLDDKNETPIIVDASFFWGSINIMFILQYISTLIDQQIYGMYRMFVASLLRIYEMLYHLISFIYSLYKIDILRSNKVNINFIRFFNENMYQFCSSNGLESMRIPCINRPALLVCAR